MVYVQDSRQQDCSYRLGSVIKEVMRLQAEIGLTHKMSMGVYYFCNIDNINTTYKLLAVVSSSQIIVHPL